jgi:hypothetical protein
MLVALPPTIHRLRMSSMDYHGDATPSKSEKKINWVIETGVYSITNSEDMTTTVGTKKRPKLSVQTSSLPSPYAKSSKGILGTASTILGTQTPTTANTVANTSQAIPLRQSPTTPKPQLSRPSQTRPYLQPIGLRSILKNAPKSPKLGMKRSHSLFSADSSSPHTTRRAFFPPVKKVRFESEGKLAVAIPIKDSWSSPELITAESEVSVPEEANASGEAASEQETTANSQVGVTAVPTQATAATRTRDGTPPPAAAPSRKKRKVRKWEWTITSPKLP